MNIEKDDVIELLEQLEEALYGDDRFNHDDLEILSEAIDVLKVIVRRA